MQKSCYFSRIDGFGDKRGLSRVAFDSWVSNKKLNMEVKGGKGKQGAPLLDEAHQMDVTLLGIAMSGDGRVR